MKHRWHEAVVATKGGMFRNEQGQREVDGRPEVIVQNCDESLSRLGIESIDPTTCTAATGKCLSKTAWARWPDWSRRAR